MASLMTPPALVWFREDLRLSDNPALTAARDSGAPVLAFYVFDEQSDGVRPLGGASRWWLHHSLAALAASLEKAGGRLVILRGPARMVIERLRVKLAPAAAYWNRRYDGPGMAVDSDVKADLRAQGIVAESFNGALLYEPWMVKSRAGEPMKVFTPFWRAAQASGPPPSPLAPVDRLQSAEASDADLGAVTLDDLALLPTRPDWAGGLRETWTPGEAGAQARLDAFLRRELKGYGDGRDRPDRAATSRLSPHLRFGEISPRQIWAAAEAAVENGSSPAPVEDLAKFQSELGWREFSHHLLFRHPELARTNVQRKFDDFPWRPDPDLVRAWRRGMTGYPIVDAGMRQLWRTGWMHNRVRMIAASFLIKHLLQDWREGEAWFWDTLVDADPANNAASWQWVAGSGADAAPYYRIFNPILQGEKFDPRGDYVRAFAPELARLPADVIHKPWTASPDVLARAGVRLGDTYPLPVVDHAEARALALAALSEISSSKG
jgi:deoxyribodipyrimidine photo-lyase